MPEGKKRSRTLRRVKRKLPGSRITTHYKARKHSVHKCGNCGNRLAGTVRESPIRQQNMPKTRKRPQRPYGGVLCSRCAREKIRTEARKETLKK